MRDGNFAIDKNWEKNETRGTLDGFKTDILHPPEDRYLELEEKGLLKGKKYKLDLDLDLIYEELRKDVKDTKNAIDMASMSNLQTIKPKIIQKILDVGIVVESVAGGKKKYKRSKKNVFIQLINKKQI